MIPRLGRPPGWRMAAHCTILAWRTPWIEEPGRLQSIGSHRVGHDLASNTTILLCVRQARPRKIFSGLRSPRACMLSRFSRVQLCNPTDCSPPGSSVHGILQARTLEWAAVPSPLCSLARLTTLVGHFLPFLRHKHRIRVSGWRHYCLGNVFFISL